MTSLVKELRLAVVVEALTARATGEDYKASRTGVADGLRQQHVNRAKQLRRVAAHYERKHALAVIKRTNPPTSKE